TWPTRRSSAARSWPACSRSRASSSTAADTPAAVADRALAVPDGLDGLRLDVALSRLFGFSRTAAADLIDDGFVRVGTAQPARSAKVRAGDWLEATIPHPPE